MATQHIDLRPRWDLTTPRRSPHKGWYVHYYDNGITKYGNMIEDGDFLEDFPGLNHIYLRLAWSFLEPEENRYDWDVIDRVIEPWRAHGYTIAFRISCKETNKDIPFATPEWVKDAGAAGQFIGPVWEPDYGDAIFLVKLERFHAAFAERYDRPWVEYVDIGSYGDWGEGHTAHSSHRDWPVEVIKRHIDIHTRHYRVAQLMVSDDIMGSRGDGEEARRELMEYIVAGGVTLRDDGVCVKWFADTFGPSTLRSPEYFERFWRTRPVDLELEHYAQTVKHDTWKGGAPLCAAVEEAHATFVGFHHGPRQWIEDGDNASVARRLANRAGYVFAPEWIELPERVAAGGTIDVRASWTNQGVAPAYRAYGLEVMFDGPTRIAERVANSDARAFLPGEPVEERYVVSFPTDAPAGTYEVRLNMVDESLGEARPVPLALRDDAWRACRLVVDETGKGR